MRTRYLGRDYFFGDYSGEALRGFTFLSLPAPRLPLPLVPSSAGTFSPDFDLHFDFSSAPALDRLPFDGALSRFLSDVVPQFCSVAEGKPLETSGSSGEEARKSRSEVRWTEGSRNEVDDFLLEGEEIGGHDDSRLETSGSDILEVELICPKVEGPFNGRNRKEPHETAQFEVVEVDVLQTGCMSSSETDDEGITLRISGFRISMDMVSIEVGITIPYLHEVEKSFFLVESIPKSIAGEMGVYSVEDSSLSHGALAHLSSLPKFEVFETSVKLDECLCSKEAFNLLIPQIKNWDDGQGDDMCVNLKELMESIDFDTLEYSSVKALSEKVPELKPISLDSLIDMDILSLKGNLFLVKDSAICPVESSVNSFQPCLVYLQEVQIPEFPSIHHFQMFGTAETVKEHIMPEQKFQDDFNLIESLYESIISSELCLVDDAFKSWPAPILCEDKRLTSLNLIIDDILCTLRPHPESVCDEIYLDWHPLTEDTCNHEICSTYINMLMTVQMYDSAPELQFLKEESVVFHLNFLDDPQEVLDISQCEEPPRMLTDSILDPNELLAKNSPSHILQNESSKIEKPLQSGSSERVPLIFETMSQSNDLKFFINARRGITSKNGENTMTEKYVHEVTTPAIPSNTASSSSHEVNFHQWNVEEHQVIMSAHILDLVDNIQKIYLAILTNETDLRQNQYLFPDADDLHLLMFPKQKLMELIINTSAKDEAFLPLTALYAIKQLAYFLCYFGIHSAYVYIRKISQTSEYLKVRLSSTQCLIEDARKKAETEFVQSHPSLSIVEDILRSKPCQNGEKILVVAERLFWLPLNRMLASMKIIFQEVGYSYGLMNHADLLDHEFRNSICQALSHSDCFLISHEDVSETFPFDKFCNIVEYGGPSSSSRICNISTKLVPLPQVHFLKVRLEDHKVLEALCERSRSQQLEYMMERASQSTNFLKGINSKEVVELINFLPTKENSYIASSESANKTDVMCDTESASSKPYSNPDTVIIVNTQNFDKEMLVSRRSSYQKILRTEKFGIQVVEREIDLPLDLIFTAAVCLVWYNARNVRITSAAMEEASYIARFMETLATNILMSLSFAFSSCILVFEGESTFLAAIMEFSDTLYAAAASLDMHLQLFCSYSPESTDEIVLSCINNNVKLNKGLYPAMLESETLAESFLVKFPSINALSAHAILSSGGMLVKFLQCSFEQRIQTIGKYHVPAESIALFNTLCRYGELGESKSGTTECSSIDSDVNSSKVQFQCKRQKCKTVSDTVDLTMDDFLYVGPQNNPDSDILEASKESHTFQTGNISSIEGMLKKRGKDKHPNSDNILADKWGLNPSETNSLDWTETEGYKHVHKDLNGEVINRNFNFLDEGFQSVENFVTFQKMPGLRTEPTSRNSQLAGRFGYSSTSRVFPPSVEINCDGDVWTNSKQHNQIQGENFSHQNDLGSNEDVLSLKRYGGLTREHYAHDHMGHMPGSSIQQILMPIYGGNLVSNAQQSTRLQEGSPWTVDLLNRIKERSKMHQQSLPCNTCLSCPGSSRNRDKYSMSRSPSTIDSYTYQGASKLKKMSRQRWQKQVGKPLGSSNNAKRASSTIAPTWTPIDKRARLNLSFTRNGHEKQSKLVWINRNRNLPTADCNLRKRLLDES